MEHVSKQTHNRVLIEDRSNVLSDSYSSIVTIEN